MRKMPIIITAIILSFLISGCTSDVPTQSDKMTVVATFYPLGEIAKQVGGDFISVATITPAGAEPHDYEPTPHDIIAIHTARIFLINGGGIDAWAEKITDLPNTTIIKMTNALGLEQSADPHFWLDPILYKKEVNFVRDAFISIDPLHSDSYKANAEHYNAQLNELDIHYKNGLAHCTQNAIITSHEAFGYLARRYNFTQLSIAGFSPDQEPSSKAIADLATLAQTEHISIIFFEAFVSARLAETIAAEIGAQTMILNPLEGLTDAEIATGENYLSLMEKNLKNLRLALICI